MEHREPAQYRSPREAPFSKHPWVGLAIRGNFLSNGGGMINDYWRMKNSKWIEHRISSGPYDGHGRPDFAFFNFHFSSTIS